MFLCTTLHVPFNQETLNSYFLQMLMVIQTSVTILLFIFVFSLPPGWRCVPCFLPMELILLYLTAIPRQLWMLHQQKNFKISFHVCLVFCLISFYCHGQISDAMSDIEVTANWGAINKSTTVSEMRSKCSMFSLKFLWKWSSWEGENKIILPVPSCYFHGLYSYWHSSQPEPVGEKLLNYCKK